MKNKKGIISIVLTTSLLLVIALILVVVFGGASLFLWFLGKSLFYLVGGVILILAAIALMKGVPTPMFVWVIGCILVILPLLFDGLQSITLASVFP